MAYKFLTNKQRSELLSELRIEDKAKYSDRIKVILLLDDGQTYKDIKKFLFLDEGTIANYRRRYKEGGIEGLVSDDYSGKKSTLSDEDLLELQLHLTDVLYNTANAICEHILQKYKVKYSISGVTALLKKLNFSFKKAKGVPGKAKKEKQLEFIEKISKIANENAPVFFSDATHPTHQTELSYGWIPKGLDTEVNTTSGRKRLNILGAISMNNLKVRTEIFESINQESVCNFLSNLRLSLRHYDKIYFVMDQGPANMARTVKDVAQMLNIELIYLPSYSPNLNPIERLWKFFKTKVLKNKYFEKFDEFRSATINFFDSIGQFKSELRSLINYNFKAVGT